MTVPMHLLRDSHQGALATIKRAGLPQLSNVGYTYDEDTKLVRISVTNGRAKVANVRRDPGASFYVSAPNHHAYVVAEGSVSLTPVAAEWDDPTVEELIDVYRSIAGEHPDWDDFRHAMVRDQRLVLRVHVDRVYGFTQDR